MPKVTLCVPAYNSEKTIAETLDSLLAQTFKDVEIIVSDNHSSDHTRDVVAGYESRGVHCVVCPQLPVKTGSPLDNCLSSGQNWNSLCQLGTGSYVGIYHADDIYEPELVARQVETLERYIDSSAVFPTIRGMDENGRLLGPAANPNQAPPHDEWFSQVDLIRRMLRVGHNLSSSGPLIRRTSWQRAGKFDAIKFEQAVDTDFWIRLAGFGPIALLHPPLVRYRIHPGQDSQHRFQLYRYRPIPIISVLQYWTGYPSVQTKFTPVDKLYLAAACAEEYLRIALNFCLDGRKKETATILAKIIPCTLPSIRLLWREKRRMQLARLFASNLLLLALRFGVGKPVAAVMARSRLGFPQWK